MNTEPAILFVCMGNICRSPSAEGFFRHYQQAQSLDRPWRVDSAGTHGYHIGHAPDARAIKAAGQYQVDISQLRARQIQESDFHEFELIIAMDEQNYQTLRQLNSRAGANASIRRMMEFARASDRTMDVPDPYYGNQSDFDHMCQLLDDSTQGLVDYVRTNAGNIG